VDNLGWNVDAPNNETLARAVSLDMAKQIAEAHYEKETPTLDKLKQELTACLQRYNELITKFAQLDFQVKLEVETIPFKNVLLPTLRNYTVSQTTDLTVVFNVKAEEGDNCKDGCTGGEAAAPEFSPSPSPSEPEVY
jgi:hypothetical protein